MPWFDTKQFLAFFGALYFLKVLCQFVQVTIFTCNTLKQLITIASVPLTQPLDVIKCEVQTLASGGQTLFCCEELLNIEREQLPRQSLTNQTHPKQTSDD